jgi:hypothetical protein
VLLAVLVLVFIWVGGYVLRVEPGSTDYIAIEETLNLYLKIDADAKYTLDERSYQEVVVNDLRGGWAGTHAPEHLRYLETLYAQDRGAGLSSAPGLLNYKLAYLAFNRLARELYHDAVASGDYVIQTPIPPTPTAQPQHFPRIDFPGIETPQSNPGYVYMPRRQLDLEELENSLGMRVNYWSLFPGKYTPGPVKINRVIRLFGMAKARVISCSVVDYTLVKRNGKWYVAGEKEIKNNCQA